MFSDEAPEAPAPAGEPPKRKRGRPSNAERAARGETTPPRKAAPAPGKRTSSTRVPRRTAVDYAKSVDDVLGLVQAVVGMRDPVAAEIVGDGRPQLSRAVGKLAANNDLVGAWLDRLGTSSDALDVVLAAGAIAVPLAAHYGLLNRTPLREAARPYAERVAARTEAARADSEPTTHSPDAAADPYAA